MRTCSLLIIIAAVVDVAYPVATSAQVAWYPIGDVNNEPHVQKLGGWAVAEHVKQVHDGLKFIKVMSGEKAPDAGVKYHLIIKAFNSNDKPARYEAYLVEEARSNTRTLIFFSPVN